MKVVFQLGKGEGERRREGEGRIGSGWLVAGSNSLSPRHTQPKVKRKITSAIGKFFVCSVRILSICTCTFPYVDMFSYSELVSVII